MEYADISGVAFEQAARRTTLADIYHQMGRMKDAEEYFIAAENIHKNNPDEKCAYLHSLWGFRYCDFLLSQNRWQEVLQRATEVKHTNECNQHKLEIALNKLMFGRAYLAQALEEKFKNTETLTLAEDFINTATEELRTAHENHHLPKGFLTRARFNRLMGKEANIIRDDLKEILAISSHRAGNMRLYQTDYHIESAWFAFDQSKPEEARQHVQEAVRLIEETNYNRRLPELEKLQQELRSLVNVSEKAQ